MPELEFDPLYQKEHDTRVWEDAYLRLFAVNENHIEQLEGYKTWVEQRGDALREEFAINNELMKRIAYLEAQLAEQHPCRLETDQPDDTLQD
jgi:hypothetical protein